MEGSNRQQGRKAERSTVGRLSFVQTQSFQRQGGCGQLQLPITDLKRSGHRLVLQFKRDGFDRFGRGATTSRKHKWEEEQSGHKQAGRQGKRGFGKQSHGECSTPQIHVNKNNVRRLCCCSAYTVRSHSYHCKPAVTRSRKGGPAV